MNVNMVSKLRNINRGLFIVVEGSNFAGKTTIINHLVNKYKDTNFKVYKFPNRETKTGKIIDKFLKNEYSFSSNDEQNKIFALNRFEQKENIMKDLNNGINIICDRYIYSGIVYPLYTNIKNLSDITEEHIIDIYKYDRYLPKPDIVLLITSQFSRNENERYHHLDKMIILEFYKKILEYTNSNYNLIYNKIDHLDKICESIYKSLILIDKDVDKIKFFD
jgi:dTMP kinase